MTSTADTAGHPDVAEISDLTEGLLPPARSAEVRRHLDGCELCADVHASLEEIGGLLGTVPGAERMPADVAGRIDAALAAEALLSASAPGPVDVPGPVDARISGSPESGDDEGHVSRETSVPSARPAGRPQAATGPGRKERKHGRRRRRVFLGAVLTAAFLGSGSLLLQSFGDHSSDTTAHGKPTPSVGPFSGNSVQNQVKGLLDGKKEDRRGIDGRQPGTDAGTGQSTPGTTESANTLLQTNAAVPDCVREALRRNDVVLGAKAGMYDGKAAYLVVVPDTEDSARVTAYVVDAACVGRQPVSAGKVLLKQSFTRA
ncbi:anti-sigma factor family protein [Streptomyces sp. NPDC048514]|uniref:anti-sigma factor family protein n=1 Tax=Streptomyces sp. NPDC048514 TaxID=3365564 RepID=UPI00371B3C08